MLGFPNMIIPFTSALLNMAGRIITVLIITFELSRTLSEDVPEFQYPCYVDVCTFPTQFCNSDKFERRCSPCSRAICRQRNVPLACRYICLKNNELSTSAKPSSTTTAPTPQRSVTQGNGNLDSVHLIMGYSAISTTLLVVLLLGFVAYYIHRKKVAKEKRTKNSFPSVSYRTVVNRNRNYDPGEELLQEITPDSQERCLYCGHQPRPEILNLQITDPPSYATYEQGKPADTPSSPSSTESVHNSAKTVFVRPMTSKPQPNVDNSDTKHKKSSEVGMQTQCFESLLNSHEADDTDETGLKMSNI